MPSSFKCLPFVLILVFLPNFAIAVEKCGNLPPLEEGLSKEEKVDALLKRATGCIHEGKLNQTIAILSELIGLDPNNMDGYLNRGSAYIQARQYELGLSDYSHVIRLHPETVEAWYNRGTAFVLLGQNDAGIADLNEAIRLKPQFARAYCNRAAGYVGKTDYEKAM